MEVSSEPMFIRASRVKAIYFWIRRMWSIFITCARMTTSTFANALSGFDSERDTHSSHCAHHIDWQSNRETKNMSVKKISVNQFNTKPPWYSTLSLVSYIPFIDKQDVERSRNCIWPKLRYLLRWTGIALLHGWHAGLCAEYHSEVACHSAEMDEVGLRYCTLQ